MVSHKDPILFLIYINNLELSVNPTFFADDSSIFICGNNINTVHANVDTTVKQLLQWFEKNRLLININKTVAMYFHNRQNNNVQYPTIKLHDKTISFINNIRFLGLWMDDNLKWSTHIQSLVKRLSKISYYWVGTNSGDV